VHLDANLLKVRSQKPPDFLLSLKGRPPKNTGHRTVTTKFTKAIKEHPPQHILSREYVEDAGHPGLPLFRQLDMIWQSDERRIPQPRHID